MVQPYPYRAGFLPYLQDITYFFSAYISIPVSTYGTELNRRYYVYAEYCSKAN